ncbi:hypothetical protein D3Z38_05290 [Clostridiales bacterium]|nr:hypothetical protein [Clostridiales bacterium]
MAIYLKKMRFYMDFVKFFEKTCESFGTKNEKGQHQYVYSHWHKELEISCLFEGKVEFYHGGIGRIVKGRRINIANPKEMHYAIPRKMPHKT